REDELKAKLEQAARTGKPLRVYLGVDPTAPDIHLGHTVVLRKLKHFQDMGHTAIFLIGDFSAMIGDPTGVSETRPPLTPEQVEANAKTYLAQVYKILDRGKTEVRYNSEWLGKMLSHDLVRLCGHYRLARMLEREDFRSRLEKNQPISVHELLYPLLTAYDAVSLRSDVELGATEQKFNLLVHRDIQREYGQPSQAVLTMPILVGLDGVQKMSKSLGNYVGISEPAAVMFGKLMSISDTLMWRYYELLTDAAPKDITELKNSVEAGTAHPMNVKKALALRIVADFHGGDAASQAQKDFEAQFQEKTLPEDIPSRHLALTGPRKLFRLLTDLKLFDSNAEAQRKIKEGAVYMADLDSSSEPRWSRMTDPTWMFDPAGRRQVVFRAGPKRLLKITLLQPEKR
ncbi:MAG: tyrosine--tRNA ligase, partial [Terriglobia bacterium]